MDVLEARELQLRKQLFGVHDATTGSITSKISDLSTRLEHLYSAVAGFSRLSDLYTGVQKELELQPSSTLGSSTPKAGEEIKRAVILSSDDRIDEVVREFRKLKEMQGVLTQLEQLRSRNPVDDQQLTALERSTDAQTQRALALHARVERVLAIYHEMISFSPLFVATARNNRRRHAQPQPFRDCPRSITSSRETTGRQTVHQQAEACMTTLAAHEDLRARRRRIKTRVRQVLGGAFVVVACCAGMLALSSRVLSSPSASNSARRLAESTNATTAASEEEDSCAGLADWELNGGIAVYIAALLYLFVALAIICDDYFVTALEKITEKLGLSQDVAGATFMAAGSSAPELFVSLADNVFAKPQESLGIGTIVGSAIFNILIIIALSALLAGQQLVLDWRPLLRDSLWYSWSIIVLTFSVWDGSVNVYESVLLFGSYACYIAYMSQNERVVNRCCKRPDNIEFSDDVAAIKDELSAEDAAAAQAAAKAVGSAAQLPKSQGSSGSSRPWTIDVERVEKSDSAASLERKTSESSAQLRRSHSSAQDGDKRAKFADASSKVNPIYQSKYRMFQYHPSLSRQSTQQSLEAGTGTGARDAPERLSSMDQRMDTAIANDAVVLQAPADASEQLGGYFEELWDVPESLAGKAWFVFTRPIVVIARLTIPDCRYPQFSGTCGFTATFVVAIIWIAFLSHYTVVWATKFGCIAGIPSSLMGLTIIAAGTSIPDALSSILVARAGHGDMAVSNALGSNVFDILLGLGLPFFISNLVYGEEVPVTGDDLELSIFILFGVLLMLVGILIVSKWRLRPLVGAFLLSFYVVYVVVSYLRGLGYI